MNRAGPAPSWSGFIAAFLFFTGVGFSQDSHDQEAGGPPASGLVLFGVHGTGSHVPAPEAPPSPEAPGSGTEEGAPGEVGTGGEVITGDSSTDGLVEGCYHNDRAPAVVRVSRALASLSVQEKIGLGGMAAYPLASAEMDRRNHVTEPIRPRRGLNSREKAALRPIFGDLVDEAQITFNAVMLTEIPIEAGVGPWRKRLATIDLGGARGQTFGLDVYTQFKDPEKEPAAFPDDETTKDYVGHIIHEMQHVRQTATLKNDKTKFGYWYFYNWAGAGFDYESNCMEAEARQVREKTLEAAFKRYQEAR